MALLIFGIILHKILEVNIVVFTHYVYLIAQHFKNEFILSTKKKQKKTLNTTEYWGIIQFIHEGHLLRQNKYIQCI